MKSAASLAMHELSEIRDRHKAELDRNIAYVKELSNEYITVENELLNAGKALLRCVLDGGENFEKIKDYIQKKQKQKAEILSTLNLPADYLDEKYDCPICRDTGYDENGLKCTCLKRLTAKYIDKNSNITELMKNQTFENFDLSMFSPVPDSTGKAPLDIINSAKTFSENFADDLSTAEPFNILFLGNAGTGKTYMSSCIANRVLSKNKTVYYQTAYKLCEIMENVKFNKYETPEEAQDAAMALKYANDVDLLIIDDLGTEFLTQFTAAALFDLLNTRLLKHKAAIISTNLSLDDMEQKYSDRLTSRIIGEYKIIRLIGADLRKKALTDMIK